MDLLNDNEASGCRNKGEQAVLGLGLAQKWDKLYY